MQLVCALNSFPKNTLLQSWQEKDLATEQLLIWFGTFGFFTASPHPSHINQTMISSSKCDTLFSFVAWSTSFLNLKHLTFCLIRTDLHQQHQRTKIVVPLRMEQQSPKDKKKVAFNTQPAFQHLANNESTTAANNDLVLRFMENRLEEMEAKFKLLAVAHERILGKKICLIFFCLYWFVSLLVLWINEPISFVQCGLDGMYQLEKFFEKIIGRVKALEILLEEKMERSIVRIDAKTKGNP